MRKLFITLSLLIALSMVLVACGGTQPAAEPEVVTVVETQIVEKEVIVEAQRRRQMLGFADVAVTAQHSRQRAVRLDVVRERPGGEQFDAEIVRHHVFDGEPQ